MDVRVLILLFLFLTSCSRISPEDWARQYKTARDSCSARVPLVSLTLDPFTGDIDFYSYSQRLVERSRTIDLLMARQYPDLVKLLSDPEYSSQIQFISEPEASNPSANPFAIIEYMNAQAEAEHMRFEQQLQAQSIRDAQELGNMKAYLETFNRPAPNYVP